VEDISKVPIHRAVAHPGGIFNWYEVLAKVKSRLGLLGTLWRRAGLRHRVDVVNGYALSILNYHLRVATMPGPLRRNSGE